MRNYVNAVVVLLFIAVCIPAEESTLTFQEGDGGTYSETEDGFAKEDFPTYNHTSHVSLVAGGAAGSHRTSFILFPDIIGSGDGQIRPTSTIVSATLSLTSTAGTGAQVSAYRIMESTVYQPNTSNGSPSYTYREGSSVQWTVPGCGGSPSREATPSDTVTVTSSYSPIDFDVTSIVQGWVDTPTVNWGIVIDADSTVQAFYSSDEATYPARRPKLTVTFTPPGPDSTPPGPVTNLTAYPDDLEIDLSWTNPTDPDFDGVLILKKEGSSPTGVPQAGTRYSAGEMIGDGEVIFVGNAEEYTHSGLTDGTTYYYDIFAYDCTPNYSTAAEISQTARDLETRIFTYVEDSYQKSEFPEYTHCRSTSLVTGSDGTNQRTALIRYPNLIGPGEDQIPDDAEIVSAALTLTSAIPKDISVPVFKVTEYWCESGKSGRYQSPSWNERQKGIPWTSPGCGEGSRESTPLDAVTITQGYSPFSWDVTTAVQTWADDRMQNKGLCFDAREESEIQVFYSSDEEQFPQYRPYLEVEYVVKPDTIPPGISISTPDASDISPAFVEGTCDADAETITISINGGFPSDVIRLNPTQWYTNVDLSASSAANIVVTAKDAADNSSAAEQDVTWTSTDIPLWSNVMIRKGDSLLLTQTGTGSVLEIDPGTGVWQNVGAPGDTLEHTYTEAGVYTVCSRIDGGAVSSIDVTVVDVNLHNSIACQVGFMRDLDVFVAPLSAKEAVSYSENDSRILHVEFNEYTDEGAALKLVPYTRGTPVLIARLGSTGPIVSTQEIDEFTLDVPAREGVVIDDDIDVGTSKLTMRPYIPDLILEFDMFASISTFEGGVTHFEVNTTDDFTQVFDEETGETVGELLYDIEVPDGEDQYCYNIDVKQESGIKIVKVGKEANINNSTCKVSINQLFLCSCEEYNKEKTEGNLEVKIHVCNGEKYDIKICDNPDSDKEPKFKVKEDGEDVLKSILKNGFHCNGESPKIYKVTAAKADGGKYHVQIANTRFVFRIIVVEVIIYMEKGWYPENKKLLATAKHALWAIAKPEGGNYLWNFEGGKATFNKKTDKQPKIIAPKVPTDGSKVVVEYTYSITCKTKKPLMITHPLHSQIDDKFKMEGVFPEDGYLPRTKSLRKIKIINFSGKKVLKYTILDQEKKPIYHSDRGFPQKCVYAFEPKELIIPYEARAGLLAPINHTRIPGKITSESVLEDDNIIRIRPGRLFYNENKEYDPLPINSLVCSLKHTWKAGVGKKKTTTVTDPTIVVGSNTIEVKVADLKNIGGVPHIKLKWKITRIIH